MRVVPNLILCCSFGSMGGNLLEESKNAEGRGDGGFVEEGYDIEGLMLQNALDPCCRTVAHVFWEDPRSGTL